MIGVIVLAALTATICGILNNIRPAIFVIGLGLLYVGANLTQVHNEFNAGLGIFLIFFGIVFVIAAIKS